MPFSRCIWSLVPWNVAIFVKCSEALKKRKCTFSCLTRLNSIFTLSSQEPREICCFESKSPYLPGETQIDAAHLCSLRTNKNEVIVLEIAQGDGWQQPFSSSLPWGLSHRVLGSCPCVGFTWHGHIWVTRVPVTSFTGSTVKRDFLWGHIHCENCVWSPLGLSISFYVLSLSLLCYYYLFWYHFKTQFSL